MNKTIKKLIKDYIKYDVILSYTYMKTFDKTKINLYIKKQDNANLTLKVIIGKFDNYLQCNWFEWV